MAHFLSAILLYILQLKILILLISSGILQASTTNDLLPVVFLNNSVIPIPSSINTSSKFSFSFLACAKGTILSQGSAFSITLEQPSSESVSYHTVLVLNWNDGRSPKRLLVKPAYSLDSNILVHIEVSFNQTGINIRLTPNSAQVAGQNILVTESFFLATVTDYTGQKNNITLGSRAFIGCVYSGAQIVISNQVKSSCPLDNWAPCKNSACPTGFTGRFCQEDIDDCKQSKPCQNLGKCIDKVKDYVCECGARYTGKNCETYLGSLCAQKPCMNGVCSRTDNGNDYICTCLESYTGRNCETKFLPCVQKPCENDGACVNDNSTAAGYKCNCSKGFSGTRCQINKVDCVPGACKNGLCIDLINSFSCNCTGSGFKGPLCDVDIDECENSNICNNGTCKDRYGTYSCICKGGYTGGNCEFEINECESNPCKNGVCTDRFLNYTCTCNPGYKGRNCDQEVNECTYGFCKNSKSCVDKLLDYKCICNEGFFGKNCTEDINECNITSNLCKNSGECINTFGSYRCTCKEGFEGKNCSVNINDCADSPCKNGQCFDGIAKYTCTCYLGFTGENCDADIDDCEVLNQPCKNNGKCMDGNNTYSCQCISSWKGQNCTIEQDPCVLFSPCANTATCKRDASKGYECNCTESYGGKNCTERIGFCFPKNPCQNDGKCVYNSDYTDYSCQCQSGFEGHNCTININECVRHPSICNTTDWEATCSDIEGSYKCKCSNQFQGFNCTDDVNECHDPAFCINGTCSNFIPTVDQPVGASCKCYPGWLGNECSIKNFPCELFKASNNDIGFCYNDAQCINNLDDKICNCTNTGYKDDRCETEIDECVEQKPCQNNASCTDKINDYNCTCIPGYTGKNCEKEINECLPKPCLNGACVDKINAYQCNCYPGFNGTNCDNDIDYCYGVDCKHGGSCREMNSTFTCRCLPGFTGGLCEIDINECKQNPCKYIDVNGKVTNNTCIQRSDLNAMRKYNFSINETHFLDRDGYECICETGLSGLNCNTNHPDCNHDFCKHNSTCLDLVDDYSCKCLPGYLGKNCSTDFDECSNNNTCLNNANCTNLVNNYTCTCVGNFTGRNCEIEINYCTKHQPCSNGATCLPKGEDFVCVCPPGFTGQKCDIETTFNFLKTGQWNISTSGVLSIKFSFRTTVDGFLMALYSPTKSKLSVYLNNGRIVLKQDSTSVTYREMKLPATNALWHHLQITLGQQVSLKVSRQGSEVYSGFNIEDVNLITVGSNNEKIAPNYAGCMQDLSINNKTLLQSNGTHTGVNFGACNKIDQCSGAPCNNHGTCIDQWISFTCDCFRQYFGDRCQFEIQAFSFQLPTTTTNVTQAARRRRALSENYVKAIPQHKLNTTHGFSFLIRTRQVDGLVGFLLDKEPASSTDTGMSYVLIELQNRYLKVTFKEEKASRTQTLVDESSKLLIADGKWLEVGITSSFVRVGDQAVNLTTPISLMINLVLMGGVDKPALYSSITNTAELLGCLQAAKIGGEFLTNQVISGAKTVSVDKAPNVGTGCPGGPVCQPDPCLFNGQCTDQWYDFSCTCQLGFSGKTCSEFGCGLNNTCQPVDSCVDVPLSSPPATSCSQSMTYNGVNGTSQFKLPQVHNSSMNFTLRTRQTTTSLLNSSAMIIVIQGGKLVFSTTNNQLTDSMPINDGQSHTVYLVTEMSPSVTTKLYVDRVLRESTTTEFLSSAWRSAIVNTDIRVGEGNGVEFKFYRGCLNGLDVGGVPVDLSVATNSDGVTPGCHRSFDSCTSNTTCATGAACKEDFNDFKCECPTFYTSKTCNETLDLTCDFKRDFCNNGTCRNLANGRSSPTVSQNGKDYFQCTCSVGYEGPLCDANINECDPDPCKNGTCVDEVNGYRCQCDPGFSGVNCENNINDCSPDLCQNGMRCIDGVNKYTCDCEGRFTGVNCEQDIDECADRDVCKQRGNCTNSHGSFSCACDSGYFGTNCQYNNTHICAIQKPCMNGGTCLSDISGYNCTCPEQYLGPNCTALAVVEDDNLPLIIGLSAAAAAIVIIVFLIFLVRFCRDKSGMEGTYSPNKEEQAGGNVEMHTVKKPKTERLI